MTQQCLVNRGLFTYYTAYLLYWRSGWQCSFTGSAVSRKLIQWFTSSVHWNCFVILSYVKLSQDEEITNLTTGPDVSVQWPLGSFNAPPLTKRNCCQSVFLSSIEIHFSDDETQCQSSPTCFTTMIDSSTTSVVSAKVVGWVEASSVVEVAFVVCISIGDVEETVFWVVGLTCNLVIPFCVVEGLLEVWAFSVKCIASGLLSSIPSSIAYKSHVSLPNSS